MSAEETFVDFCLQLSTLFCDHCYNFDDLARAASYFWEKADSSYKEQWKMAAKNRNKIEMRTGKQKLKGFWYFARTLETFMCNYELALYYDVWQNMLPQYQQLWYDSSESLIDQEIEKIFN